MSDMNKQLYDAMCAEFTKPAVYAALGALGCFWDCLRSKGFNGEDYPYELALGDRGDWRVLPGPAATVLLCDVAEGLLWGSRVRIHRYKSGFVVHIDVSGHTYMDCITIHPTKPAAVLAALTAEAK